MKFLVPTTSQVERTYVVDADSSEQAHARLRTYLADPEAMKEGVVELEGEKNTTDPKVKIQEIKERNGRVARAGRRAPAEGDAADNGGEKET